MASGFDVLNACGTGDSLSCLKAIQDTNWGDSENNVAGSEDSKSKLWQDTLESYLEFLKRPEEYDDVKCSDNWYTCRAKLNQWVKKTQK